MRKKHGFTPNYIDVQAPTATMNKHRHSRCHYKRNSGSTPTGTNNPPNRRACGTTTSGRLASDLCSSNDGPRTDAAAGRLSFASPRGGREPDIKAKEPEVGPRVALTVLSAEKLSPAATTSAPTVTSTCPPTPHQRAPAAPKRTDRSSLPSSSRKREWDRPRTRVPPSRRTTCWDTPPPPPGAAGHRRLDKGRNVAPWLGSNSSPSPAWLEGASSAELEDGFHPQTLEEVGRRPTRRQAPPRLALRPSKDDEDPRSGGRGRGRNPACFSPPSSWWSPSWLTIGKGMQPGCLMKILEAE
jgi:hypothetical protein